MKRRLVTIGVALALLGPAGWTADEPEKLATASAEAWLALVDQGRYGESWDAAAKYFRNATSRDQWTSTAAAAREPFGKLVSRSVRSATFKTSLPGVPDGRYVSIVFNASYELKKEARELVTTSEEDGAWKVAGYFVN